MKRTEFVDGWGRRGLPKMKENIKLKCSESGRKCRKAELTRNSHGQLKPSQGCAVQLEIRGKGNHTALHLKLSFHTVVSDTKPYSSKKVCIGITIFSKVPPIYWPQSSDWCLHGFPFSSLLLPGEEAEGPRRRRGWRSRCCQRRRQFRPVLRPPRSPGRH